MGTPQSDTSWAGWAISSFTNKLAAASGDIQPTPNSAGNKPKGNRPSTINPTIDAVGSTSSTTPVSTLHRQSAAPPQPGNTRDSQEDHTTSNDDFTTWGDMEEEIFFDAPAEKHPASSPTPTNVVSAKANFDDGGEPDFAGWLNAQAQAKAKTHLPKGLSRSSAASTVLPGAGSRSTVSSNTSNTASTKKIVAKPKPTPTTTKKPVDTKPNDQSWTDDDGWGDGWE
jgi:SCY1-like protein 1